MKKKAITWTFKYEVDDTEDNSYRADSMFGRFQADIEKVFPKSNQIIAYIHKETEKEIK